MLQPAADPSLITPESITDDPVVTRTYKGKPTPAHAGQRSGGRPGPLYSSRSSVFIAATAAWIASRSASRPVLTS